VIRDKGVTLPNLRLWDDEELAALRRALDAELEHRRNPNVTKRR